MGTIILLTLKIIERKPVASLILLRTICLLNQIFICCCIILKCIRLNLRLALLITLNVIVNFMAFNNTVLRRGFTFCLRLWNIAASSRMHPHDISINDKIYLYVLARNIFFIIVHYPYAISHGGIIFWIFINTVVTV